jgi:hypothetical protein
MLPYFIEDAKAHQFNALWQAEFAAVATEDLIQRANAAREVHKWALNAAKAGLALRCELSDFIAAVKQFDPADTSYWQRVYSLAGLDDDVTHCSICDQFMTIPVPKSDRRPDDMWFCGPCFSTKRWLENNLDELGNVSEEKLMDWIKKHPDMSKRLQKVLKFVGDTKRW